MLTVIPVYFYSLHPSIYYLSDRVRGKSRGIIHSFFNLPRPTWQPQIIHSNIDNEKIISEHLFFSGRELLIVIMSFFFLSIAPMFVF